MLANAIAMATIPEEDINRAVRFYSDILGLKLIEEPNEASALFEAAGGSQVFIYMRGRSTAEHTAITFSVEKLEEIVDELTTRGVVFEQYNFDDFSTDEPYATFFHEDNGYYSHQWLGYKKKDGSYDYFARGILGQFIYVSPEKNVVIVRTSEEIGEIDWWPSLFRDMANEL